MELEWGGGRVASPFSDLIGAAMLQSDGALPYGRVIERVEAVLWLPRSAFSALQERCPFWHGNAGDLEAGFGAKERCARTI